MTDTTPTRRAHYLYVNMRDIGCNCGVRYRATSLDEAGRLHAEHLAAVRTDPPAPATVETFSTFCHCKPPHLNADNVCSCGVAWSS